MLQKCIERKFKQKAHQMPLLCDEIKDQHMNITADSHAKGSDDYFI